MDVFVANEQDVPIDEQRVSALARHALSAEDVDDEAELSVLFVTPDHIRKLNSRFAGNDYVTDVLAFPMTEEEEEDDELLLGDVVVCPAVAQRNATQYGHSLAGEVDVLVVHGILHLLGYDHQGDKDRVQMDARLRQLIDSFDPARA